MAEIDTECDGFETQYLGQHVEKELMDALAELVKVNTPNFSLKFMKTSDQTRWRDSMASTGTATNLWRLSEKQSKWIILYWYFTLL